MVKRISFFILLFCSLAFTACQKELPVADKDYKTLGTSANDFLSSSSYTSLIIEIDYMPGYAPDVASLNNLSAFLNTFINKPAGIRINQKQIAASGKASLTLNDIVKLEKQYRTAFTALDVLTAHILIADTYYSNATILATSYWNTSTCLFGKPISDFSGGAGQVTRTQLMSTLLEHEFGHLLGLVDQGSPMKTFHKDVANGAHCDNPNCLMYYAIETTDVNMNNGIPLPDANCMDDLKANGGK